MRHGRLSERDIARGETIERQDVVANVAQIESLRDLRYLRRLERSPCEVRLQSRDACNLRAPHLALQIAPGAMRANAQQIVGEPCRRLVIEQSKFGRQELRILLDELHIAVDPGYERFGDAFGIRFVRQPLTIEIGAVGGQPSRVAIKVRWRARRIARVANHGAAIKKEPRRTIARDHRRSEHLGESSETPSAPQIDLPQPVACRVETLREERVVLRLRIDVRDAPGVDKDLDRLVETRDEVAECWNLRLASRRTCARRLSDGSGGQDEQKNVRGGEEYCGKTDSRHGRKEQQCRYSRCERRR